MKGKKLVIEQDPESELFDQCDAENDDELADAFERLSQGGRSESDFSSDSEHSEEGEYDIIGSETSEANEVSDCGVSGSNEASETSGSDICEAVCTKYRRRRDEESDSETEISDSYDDSEESEDVDDLYDDIDLEDEDDSELVNYDD